MTIDAWKRHLRLWVPAAAFLLVNLGFLATYRLVLAEEAELGRGLLERRRAELSRTEDRARELEAAWTQAKETREGLQSFYAERLATEARMLTTVIATVKELASKAGLEPADISYGKESIERQDLVLRTIVFRVEGTYGQLRQLINFLEITETFLILEEVSLASRADTGGRLGIDLQISTLFAEPGAAEVAGAQE